MNAVLNVLVIVYVVIGLIIDGVVSYRMIQRDRDPDIESCCMNIFGGTLIGLLWPIATPYWCAKFLMAAVKRVRVRLAEAKKPPLNASEGRIVQ